MDNNVENTSDQILRSEVQLAQTNMSIANVVVDSSSPVQAQLSVFHNNNDTEWYANSAKAVNNDRK